MIVVASNKHLTKNDLNKTHEFKLITYRDLLLL